jgi:hypothetical protein
MTFYDLILKLYKSYEEKIVIAGTLRRGKIDYSKEKYNKLRYLLLNNFP